MRTTNLYLFPTILKTTLLCFRILAFIYLFFISLGLFHLARFASWYHDFNDCSESLLERQNVFKVSNAITLTFQDTIFPNWEQVIFNLFLNKLIIQ